MIKISKILLVVTGLIALVSTTVWAGDVEVKGKGVKFAPVVVFVQPGDVVNFRNMASHFVESIRLPDGAEAMISDMGADYSYVAKKEGVYFYKCPPHWGARMGGLIVAGDTSNLTATLEEYKAQSDDKVAQGFLKKIIKKINKGKIKVPE